MLKKKKKKKMLAKGIMLFCNLECYINHTILKSFTLRLSHPIKKQRQNVHNT